MDSSREFCANAPTYGTLLGIGVGITSLGMVIPWLQAQVFLMAVGATFSLVILVAFLRELRYSAREFGHEMEYKKWDLERLQRETVPVAPSPAPVVAETWTRPGANRLGLKIAEYANPPTFAFIEWLFKSANDEREIPSERVSADYGVKFNLWNTNEANEWLSILDGQGITEKTRETKNGNAPRRLVEGATLADALARFGLSPTPPTRGG